MGIEERIAKIEANTVAILKEIRGNGRQQVRTQGGKQEKSVSAASGDWDLRVENGRLTKQLIGWNAYAFPAYGLRTGKVSNDCYKFSHRKDILQKMRDLTHGNVMRCPISPKIWGSEQHMTMLHDTARHCQELGIYLMLTPYGMLGGVGAGDYCDMDSRMGGPEHDEVNRKEITKEVADCLRKLAEFSKQYDCVLIGTLNEPRKVTDQTWAFQQKHWIETLRKAGYDRVIFTEGHNWANAIYADAAIELSKFDSQICHTAHHYFDQGSRNSYTKHTPSHWYPEHSKPWPGFMKVREAGCSVGITEIGSTVIQVPYTDEHCEWIKILNTNWGDTDCTIAWIMVWDAASLVGPKETKEQVNKGYGDVVYGKVPFTLNKFAQALFGSVVRR